jgi:hypothetical protein
LRQRDALPSRDDNILCAFRRRARPEVNAVEREHGREKFGGERAPKAIKIAVLTISIGRNAV